MSDEKSDKFKDFKWSACVDNDKLNWWPERKVTSSKVFKSSACVDKVFKSSACVDNDELNWCPAWNHKPVKSRSTLTIEREAKVKTLGWNPVGNGSVHSTVFAISHSLANCFDAISLHLYFNSIFLK